MDAKHTPGPWEVTGISQDTGSVSIGQRDLRIVIADVTNAASFGDMLEGAMRRGGGRLDHRDARTQLSNARLIAAAPDMLEALRAIRKEARKTKPDPDEIWTLAQDAIAKAEGR